MTKAALGREPTSPGPRGGYDEPYAPMPLEHVTAAPAGRRV